MIFAVYTIQTDILLDDGRISMMFREEQFTSLPDYELEESLELTPTLPEDLYPFLNIVIQVVGNSGK